MMKITVLTLLAAACALSQATNAHHTFASEYEREKMITLEAEVAGVFFQNPHVRLDIVRTTDNGSTEFWVANSVSPGAVSHRGWLADTIAVGDSIRLYGNLGSNDSKRLWIQTITLEDGTEIFPVGRIPDTDAD